LPEFQVTIATVRSGTHTVQIVADDATAAHSLVQAECQANQCHCPSEWCSDDVESDVIDVTLVVVDGAAPSTARAFDDHSLGE